MPGIFFSCSSMLDEGPVSVAMCVVPCVCRFHVSSFFGATCHVRDFREENGDRTNHAPVVMVCCTLLEGSNAFFHVNKIPNILLFVVCNYKRHLPTGA